MRYERAVGQGHDFGQLGGMTEEAAAGCDRMRVLPGGAFPNRVFERVSAVLGFFHPAQERTAILCRGPIGLQAERTGGIRNRLRARRLSESGQSGGKQHEQGVRSHDYIRHHHSSASDSRTAPTWPVTFTLGKMFAILPFASTTKVERSIPM